MQLEDSPLNLNHRFDSICVYVDERSEIITGSGLDDVLRLTGSLSSGRIHVYFGFQYFDIHYETQIKPCVMMFRKVLRHSDFPILCFIQALPRSIIVHGVVRQMCATAFLSQTFSLCFQ